LKSFLINLLMAFIWVTLTGVFTSGQFLVGFILGFFILWLGTRGGERSSYFKKARQVAGFSLFFLWELVKSNLRLAHDVVTPRFRMKPGVVAVPLDVETDEEITLLANLISLTPGSLSLDVSDDRKVLYVHAMFVEDPKAFRREIKEGLERRVMEVLR
jgi:multicomponent Na+:H+ antiporter subunit E